MTPAIATPPTSAAAPATTTRLALPACALLLAVALWPDPAAAARYKGAHAKAGDSSCAPPAELLQFEQNYIDTARAGGEPILRRHPDGQLLWGSHAGTTHFYSPAAPSPTTGAFLENYAGQTYYYVAEASDGYETWDFVPRLGPGPGEVAPLAGVPASGFSDPEFAIDAAGNVYLSEINLANIAVSKSTDGGRSYGLQNVIAFSISDRQWMAADRENELYMAASGFGGGPVPGEPVGNLSHFIAKSTDTGATFNEPFVIDPIVGDLQIDKQRGILYSLHAASGELSMARFPNIREEDSNFTVDILPIAVPAGIPSSDRTIGPTFAIDDAGNLYATWPEQGSVRPRGIYYAYSTDQAQTWSTPQRVDTAAEDKLWPWIAVGAPGQVVISWLQTNVATNSPSPGEVGDNKPWHVMAAHTSSGLGCEGETSAARLAAFNVVQASDEPPHTGTVCQGGTLCQALLIDRRLGDYFAVEVAGDGSVHIAVSDTRQGGAVALPLHIRQVGGPKLDGSIAVAPAAPARAQGQSAGGAASPLALALLLWLAGTAGRRGARGRVGVRRRG